MMNLPAKTIELLNCPIFCYHHFSFCKHDDMAHKTTAQKFEEDIQILLNNGYTSITLKDRYEYENGDKELPQKPFIITIDDGYESCYKIAFVLLKKYGIFADIFINTSSVGIKINDINGKFLSFMDWGQAAEMEQSGLINIHSHGKWHQKNTEMNDEKFLENINESYRQIKEIKVNKDFICYSYPTGDFNEKTIQAVKKQGYAYQLISNSVITQQNIREGCAGRMNADYHQNMLRLLEYRQYFIDILEIK